jgi:hypothetical protein
MFLRTGAREQLQGVVEHNRHDVVSTAVLVAHVVRRLQDPLTWAEDGAELLAAAELWSRVGDLGRAATALDRGLELCRSSLIRRRLLRARGRLAQRQRDVAAALSAWQRYRTEFPDENLGYVEVSKIYEHRLSDPARALSAAEAAPTRGSAIEHRMGRLRRRLPMPAVF